jgi:hypothetical protein
MSNDITLSAGVRQTCFRFRARRCLMALTQNRLATARRTPPPPPNLINFSPHDHSHELLHLPALNDRANDLNSLLYSIGSGAENPRATDKGLTSLTKLGLGPLKSDRPSRRGKASHPAATYARSTPIATSRRRQPHGDEPIARLTANTPASPPRTSRRSSIS